ncbi:glycoside hydrolase family 88 protein [Algibacter lectus]|nr:glycoside hydrolase family 88 protein [Algibacter lectus]
MKIKIILIFLISLSFLGCNNSNNQKSTSPSEPISQKNPEINPMTKTGVLELMDLTSTWQKNNLPHVMNIPGGIIEPLTTHNWVRATYLSGMMAYYDLTKNEEIFNYVNGLCEDIDYKLGERERHADEFAIGRVYTDIFLVNREPKVLEDMYKRIDYIIENPKRGPVVGWNGDTNWSWADALFMAPPAWLKLYTCSGERKYLREMDVRFWDTYEHLYSKEDSLFFRDNRFKWNKEEDNVKSKNGQKVFWGGRGNGWVVGGLVDILTYTPGDYHNRKKYKQLYIEMMAKIASIQSEDGMWRTSLLDVEQYPVKEFSASAFFCYAMAWGYKQ